MVFGSLLLMGAQTLWGGYTIISKPMLARGRPPLLALTGANVCSIPFIWAASVFLGGWAELPSIADWSTATWLGVAYMIVFASGLSQVMYIYGLRDVTPSQAISFSYLMPVFTAGLAAAILGEQVTLLTLGCGALIVLGLWLVNRRTTPTAS
jgi:drug/metabolite transporter (DMT)-like permease